MQVIKNMLKKDNRGLTLIELVIAMALVAVVGTTVFGFMVVGAKTFSSTSSEVSLQNEDQIAFNQMQDIIIDTAVGIDYGYYPSGSLSRINVADDSSIPTNCDAKFLLMYNLDTIYELKWEPNYTNPALSKLYYAEHGTSVTSSNEVLINDAAGVTYALMSEYISSFKVDLSRMKKNGIVRIDLTYIKDGKEYSSSHNITLRNKILSGNAIPEYVTPPSVAEPSGINGPSVLYLEPGDTYNIKDSTRYSVSGNGVSQSLRYYIVDQNDTDIDTELDSQSGLLKIGRGQKKDFDIRLATDYAVNNVSKIVTIRVMRIDTVSVNFISSVGALEETSTGSAEDDLVEGEEFVLKATPEGKHIWNESGGALQVSELGKTVDLSVTWEKVLGADNFTLTDNNDNTCTCKMNDVLNLGDDATLIMNKYFVKDISVKATSSRSIESARPYFTAGVPKAVYGTWTGRACKKKGDFNIIFNNGGDYQRGQHYPIQVMEVNADGKSEANFLHSGMIMPDGVTLDLTEYVGLVDLRLIETAYEMDGTVIERLMDASEYSDCLGGEGTHWGFLCPYSYNPNATYTYQVTLHLAEKKPGDTGNNVYMLPYNGYTVSDYKYSSNMATVTFDRLKLSYINSDNISNLIISDDMNTAKYYPRSFAKSNPPAMASIKYDYTNQFKDAQNYIESWNLYVYNEQTAPATEDAEEHTYCLYDSSTAYDVGNVSGMLQFETFFDGKPGMRIRFNQGSWRNDTVPHIRMVPIYMGGYPLFDNYIDIYLWNIEIPNDGVISTILELMGVDTGEKSYFPSPIDTSPDIKFPGPTKGSRGVWSKPCFNSKYPDQVQYRITELPSNGTNNIVTYSLELFVYNKKSTQWEEIALYHCDSNNDMWAMEQ